MKTAVMRETLRLAATAPMRSVAALEDTTIGGGKYAVKKGQMIAIQTWELHRDPAVWGDDVRSVFMLNNGHPIFFCRQKNSSPRECSMGNSKRSQCVRPLRE
jgi:hypothetical protein